MRVLALLLLSSILLNGYLLFRLNTQDLQNADIEKYPLLSPRILQSYQNDILINFLPLRQKLKTLIQAYGESFALYFEYLPSGTSIGINEKQEFYSASLIKLPIVMAYYHEKRRLGYKEDPTVIIKESFIDKGSGSLWKRGAGAKVTLGEAARLAITESDNTAAFILTQYINQEDFDDVYKGLDIDLQTQGAQVIITAKHYSSILRALYFSAVLDKDDSSEILSLLTKTPFNDKLVAGIPKGIPVAHKIGILKEMVYQDCGIVYVPKRPYLLCIVSFSHESQAQERMKLVSNEIYNFVSSVNK